MKERFRIVLILLVIILVAVVVIIEPHNIVDPYRAKNLSFARTKLEILPKIILKQKLWQDNETTIFLHTPKTGGTNLVNLVDAISSMDSDMVVRKVSSPFIEGRSPTLFTEGHLGGLNTITSNISDFNGKEVHLDFISVHMPVPELEVESKVFGDHEIFYISLIRDPIERELSSTNFDFQRGYIEKPDAVSHLLEKAIDNPQTRLLAGVSSMSGECTEITLERAKENIKNRFKFVAPTEDVETVMSIVANHFGIYNVAYARAQITGMKAITTQDPELYAKLALKHKYDLELYDWIKKEWALWKKQNIEIISNKTHSKDAYLTLMPNFYEALNPVIMTLEQIEKYNQDNSLEIIPHKEIHKNDVIF